MSTSPSTSPLRAACALGLAALLLAPGAARAEEFDVTLVKVKCLKPATAIDANVVSFLQGFVQGGELAMKAGGPLLSMSGPEGEVAVAAMEGSLAAIDAGVNVAQMIDRSRSPDDLSVIFDGRNVWPGGDSEANQEVRGGQELSVNARGRSLAEITRDLGAFGAGFSAMAQKVDPNTHTIQLWERDVGPDDLLGSVTFVPRRPGTLTFQLVSKEEDSSYLVEVRVDAKPRGAGGIVANRTSYLRVSDASLYLHAYGGSTPGAQETLHACPREANHPNCQWVFEPSPTRPGAWYIRVSDQGLYLHASGGSDPGAKETLHACPKDADHPNCQWIAEPSPTRPGAVYLRSAGGGVYLHASGGSTPGAEETLHACPKDADHPNCQWFVE